MSRAYYRTHNSDAFFAATAWMFEDPEPSQIDATEPLPTPTGPEIDAEYRWYIGTLWADGDRAEAARCVANLPSEQAALFDAEFAERFPRDGATLARLVHESVNGEYAV